MKDGKFNKNLCVLFFAKIFTSLGFSVIFSSLFLFSKQDYGLSSSQAITLTATVIALNYILPLLGGYLGHKLINFKYLYVLGMLIQSVGYLLLSLRFGIVLKVGLACFLIGSMVGSVGIIEFVNASCKQSTTHRRKGQLWNYCAMNAGILLGYFVAGVAGLTFSYHLLFLLIAILPVISAFLIAKFLTYVDQKPLTLQSFFLVGLILIVVICIVSLVLAKSTLTHILLSLIIFVEAVLFLIFMKRSERKEKTRIIVFFIFMLVSIGFWTIYMLVPTVMTELIKYHTHATIFRLHVQAQWLDAIDPVLLVLLTPLLAKKLISYKGKTGKSPLTSQLFLIGFVIVFMTTIFLSEYLQFKANQFSILIIVVYYISLTLGELFVGPEGYTLPAKLLNGDKRKLATGAWVSTLGIASLISTYLSHYLLFLINQRSYHFVFLFISIITAPFVLLLLALIFFERRFI